jgi:hypothetical protein
VCLKQGAGIQEETNTNDLIYVTKPADLSK